MTLTITTSPTVHTPLLDSSSSQSASLRNAPDSSGVPPAAESPSSHTRSISSTSVENSDQGRTQVLSHAQHRPAGRTIPVYSGFATSKVDRAGNRYFECSDPAVAGMLNFTHKKEQAAGIEGPSLHELIGSGMRAGLTAGDKILEMRQVLRKIFGPTKVNMMKGKKDPTLEEMEVEGNVLNAALFDQMELGGAAWGPKKIPVPADEHDPEQGTRELTVTEYLATGPLEPKCNNQEVVKRIKAQLHAHPEVVADVMAEIIRSIENEKTIDKKMVIGFTISQGASAVGAGYEYVVGPRWKNWVTGTTIEPSRLPLVQKFKSAAIDLVPPGGLEGVDVVGNLIMKEGGVVEDGGPEQNEDVDWKGKLGQGAQGLGIALAAAIPVLLLAYFAPVGPKTKIAMAIAAFFAEPIFGSGATGGVNRDIRNDYTRMKAQILSLIEQGFLAMPATDKEKKHTEDKAKRTIRKTSNLATTQAAVGLAMLVSIIKGAVGPHTLNLVSDSTERAFNSGYVQASEATGIMVLTLLAMYVGLPGRIASKFVSNDAKKSSQRIGKIFDRACKNEKISVFDNELIDKQFLAKTGEIFIAGMSGILVGIIKGQEKLGGFNDSRDEARLPYSERLATLHAQQEDQRLAEGLPTATQRTDGTNPRIEELGGDPVSNTTEQTPLLRP